MAMVMATAIATATKHKISAQLSSRLLVLGSSVSVPPICYQKLYRMEEGIRKVSFKLRQQFAAQQLQRQVFCSMPNRITGSEEYKASATATATATGISEVFEKWCKAYGKTYSSEEEKRYRFNLFQKEYDEVTRHNQMEGKSWTAGLNQFSDLTLDETYLPGLSDSFREGLISREQYFQVLEDYVPAGMLEDYVRFDTERRGEGLISREQFFQVLEDYEPAGMLEDYVPADLLEDYVRFDTERRGMK